MVYIALLALLVITVLIAQFHLGAFGIVLALVIAITKAVLVILYFMHLRQASRLTWLFAGAGFVWLMIMFSFLLLDYVSRGWVGQ
jgi:cytochrome c oxidase subunit 4